MHRQTVILGYQDIYKENSLQQVDLLLAGICLDTFLSKIEILNNIDSKIHETSCLLAFLHDEWFSGKNNSFLNNLEHSLKSFSDSCHGAKISIFNAPTTLFIIEKFLYIRQTRTYKIADYHSIEQIELNILIAYLIINDEQKRAGNGNDIAQIYPDEIKHWRNLSRAFQSADIINRNPIIIFATQIYKASLYFPHLEESSDTAELLQVLLKSYDAVRWEDLFDAISSLTLQTIDSLKRKGERLIKIDFGIKYGKIYSKILQNYDADNKSDPTVPDHLFLRLYPILRKDANRFQILFSRFFCEKIFRGLYFELRSINLKKELFSDSEFRRRFTSDFSGGKLLYTVLDKIFARNKIQISSADIELQFPGLGITDYIGYQSGNIFLFESKDVLIKDSVRKDSIISELRGILRKAFFEDKGDRKGVLQLANNVKMILEGQLQKVGCPLYDYVSIYPVIIVHSDAFNVVGLNQILYQWFNEACTISEINKEQAYIIKNVVLIDIDTFIIFQNIIQTEGFELNKLIDLYLIQSAAPIVLNNVSKPNDLYIHQLDLTFTHFLEDYVIQNSNRTLSSIATEVIASVVANVFE